MASEVISRISGMIKVTVVALAIPISAWAQQEVHQQIPVNPPAVVVDQPLNFPCWYCLAVASQGGGRSGATASIFDLHVISSKYDEGFPRAITARIESECENCQPTALTAQSRGLNPSVTVWAANLEAYSQGRASVAEFNMGAALGGYVLDVAPVRMPDGTPSRIDAILKVEGFKYDPGAAHISTYIDAKMNPDTALIRLPADQGAVTLFATADGRMREVWSKVADGRWRRETFIDGVAQDADSKIAVLEARVEAMTLALKRAGLLTDE